MSLTGVQIAPVENLCSKLLFPQIRPQNDASQVWVQTHLFSMWHAECHKLLQVDLLTTTAGERRWKLSSALTRKFWVICRELEPGVSHIVINSCPRYSAFYSSRSSIPTPQNSIHLKYVKNLAALKKSYWERTCFDQEPYLLIYMFFISMDLNMQYVKFWYTKIRPK